MRQCVEFPTLSLVFNHSSLPSSLPPSLPPSLPVHVPGRARGRYREGKHAPGLPRQHYGTGGSSPRTGRRGTPGFVYVRRGGWEGGRDGGTEEGWVMGGE